MKEVEEFNYKKGNLHVYPDKWKVTKLGIVTIKVGSGITPKGGSSVYLETGIPLIRSQNVLFGRLDLSDVVYISPEQHEKMNNTKLQSYDVLLNITGASIGRCAVIPEGFEEGNVNQHVCIIRSNAQHLDPIYLMQFLNSDVGQDQIWSFQAGGNRQGLNFEQIRAFNIPLPPLEEQQKIAAILSTWDDAITLTEQLIAALQRRKQALMQLLLTGEVRFQEFEGKEWEEVRLQDIAQVNADALSEKVSPDREFFYIDLSSVNEGTIDMPENKIRFADLPSRARRILHFGDVMMATVRPNLRGFALCDFEPIDIICSTGFALISPHDIRDSQYIYQNLFSPSILGQLQDLVTGSNYPAVNSSEVKKLNFPFPSSVEERIKIADALQGCDEEIKLLTKISQELVSQKRGLMQQLLTGAVRVRV